MEGSAIRAGSEVKIIIIQGVVTPMLPIDTLATGIKMFDRENNALIP